jgi:hypothetical protein
MGARMRAFDWTRTPLGSPEVSRITQGRIELEKRPVDVAAVVTQALETVEPQLREKRHKLTVTTSSYEPLYVQGDFARLVQCCRGLHDLHPLPRRQHPSNRRRGAC